MMERLLHPSKQLLETSSTQLGMQIDDSDEQRKNAEEPIRDSLEPDSNVTDPRLLQ
jgi:hypothetical protein